MEINFENKMLDSYRELSCQQKKIQESCEAVVPDTKDDIGKIVSVQTDVFLKSKDVLSRGVKISGEACAALIYISENEENIDCVKLKKYFEMEFETEEAEAEALTHVKLCITNAEARAVNPRKLSLSFEITGMLQCYKSYSIIKESELPAFDEKLLHGKNENCELLLPSYIGEKMFTVNEQFIFPKTEKEPEELLYQKVNFDIKDAEALGSKIILKGKMNISCCYLSEGTAYPLSCDFSRDFSQIIDSGETALDDFKACVQLSAGYYELINTINGQKALDAEVHGVIQLVSREKQKISYISDAYSNFCPTECKLKELKLLEKKKAEKINLQKEEKLPVSEDCEDILWLGEELLEKSLNKGIFSGILNIDILYKTLSGSLGSVRRIINIEQELSEEGLTLLEAEILSLKLKKEGNEYICCYELEISGEYSSVKDLSIAEQLELREEMPYDSAKLPAVYMVQQDKDSLWDIAKRCHSSLESIEFMNPEREKTPENLLLVPKEW